MAAGTAMTVVGGFSEKGDDLFHLFCKEEEQTNLRSTEPTVHTCKASFGSRVRKESLRQLRPLASDKAVGSG